jgi:tetratricopeptide (TPR) repeat protein
MANVATASAPPAMSPELLARLTDLYDRGQYLQAYQEAAVLGPLDRWQGIDALLLGGRLAHNLGAVRLGRLMHRRAYRLDRRHPEAIYYYAHSVHERYGPLVGWHFLRSQAWPQSGEIAADCLALQARILSCFRDFDSAQQHLARAEALSPGRPWLCVERAMLLERQDLYAPALASARTALAQRPWYRPALQQAAHLLTLLDRADQAIELLTEAQQHCQSVMVLAQLAGLHSELGHYQEARRLCEQLPALCPLPESGFTSWILARRSDAAYDCGDFQTAAELARQSGTVFHLQVAQRLSSCGTEGRRVLLSVPFVRQHHLTCAPATLAALGRYWRVPTDHLSIAQAICYDGTPAHGERTWAQANGFVAREFTLTWDSACALLDRGIPFMLCTVEPTSGHMQAVIGYDSRRGTLLVRDPYERSSGEFVAEAMLKRYAASGPRCMVLVPTALADRLEGIELPEAALYDHAYAVQEALLAHDRQAALDTWNALSQAAPNHRLTHWTRRSIAVYDADGSQQLDCVRRLLEIYPDNAVLGLMELGCLRNLSRAEQRLQTLVRWCARRGADPAFWQQYAQELAADSRQHAAAERLLRRVLRARPQDAGSYFILANVLWSRGSLPEAMELYRVAACLDDKDEQLALGYFNASRHFKRTDEAMRFLASRCEAAGARSSQPARTYFRAAALVERTREGFTVLEQALRLRPEDGDLLLYAADAHGRYGNFQRAATLLQSADGRTRDASRLRTAATLASYQGQLQEALDLWRKVVTLEPLAVEAQSALVQLLAETTGREAALEHLRTCTAQFPYSYPLHQLRVEWLRRDGGEEYERVLRHMIQVSPSDAWCWRELALCLSRQGRHEEALAAADQGMGLDTASSYGHSVRGAVLAAAGQLEPAEAAYRQAISLSVDNEPAIDGLMALCDRIDQRRQALALVHDELVRQVIYGDGLLAYRQYARDILPGDELLASLRQAWQARPDLWHAWSALIRQLAENSQLDEALELAHQATERFCLLPALWLDLAYVHQLRGQDSQEIEALRQALAISPGWGLAARRLAAACERGGDLQQSRALLQQAVSWSPLDAFNYGCLADVVWRLGEQELALKHMQRAVELDPGYEWAWRVLRDWGCQLKRPNLAGELARELTSRRGGEARAWLILARSLVGPDVLEEQLAALDRAAALEPRESDIYDLRATLLAQAGRFEDAAAACRPPAWPDGPPSQLRGRSAWLLAEQGWRREAISQMQDLLNELPNYFWGWYQLSEWYRAQNQYADYLAAAEQLRRLSPQEPQAWGTLGEAHQLMDQYSRAIACYRRALELQPDYPFAGLSLFDLLLLRKEYAQAQEILTHLQTHVGGALVAARAVQLATAQEQWPQGLDCWLDVCAAADDEPWPLKAAYGALRAAGYGRQALERLAQQVLQGRSGLPAARFLVEQCCEQNEFWRLERTLLALGPALGRQEDPVAALAVTAITHYLVVLVRSLRRRRVRRYISRHERFILGNNQCWSAAIFALFTAGWKRRAMALAGDWRQRQDLEPYMLLNVALACRTAGSDRQAADAHHRALTLPADDTTNAHMAWLAYGAAMAGQTDAALELLGRLRTPLRSDDDALCQAVRAVVAVGLASSRREGAAQAMQHLSKARRLDSSMGRGPVGRAVRRCGRRAARQTRSLRLLLMAWRA